MSEDGGPPSRPAASITPWRLVWIALAISILGTAVLGGVAFAIDRNVWWIALGGAASLMAGGGYLGSRSGESEPLYGSLLAILYFGPVVVILFGGMLTDWLPDPLPGLGIGDSTFYFVSPLLMLAAAVAATVFGGRMGQREPRAD